MSNCHFEAPLDIGTAASARTGFAERALLSGQWTRPRGCSCCPGTWPHWGTQNWGDWKHSPGFTIPVANQQKHSSSPSGRGIRTRVVARTGSGARGSPFLEWPRPSPRCHCRKNDQLGVWEVRVIEDVEDLRATNSSGRFRGPYLRDTRFSLHDWQPNRAAYSCLTRWSARCAGSNIPSHSSVTCPRCSTQAVQPVIMDHARPLD